MCEGIASTRDDDNKVMRRQNVWLSSDGQVSLFARQLWRDGDLAVSDHSVTVWRLQTFPEIWWNWLFLSPWDTTWHLRRCPWCWHDGGTAVVIQVPHCIYVAVTACLHWWLHEQKDINIDELHFWYQIWFTLNANSTRLDLLPRTATAQETVKESPVSRWRWNSPGDVGIPLSAGVSVSTARHISSSLSEPGVRTSVVFDHSSLISMEIMSDRPILFIACFRGISLQCDRLSPVVVAALISSCFLLNSYIVFLFRTVRVIGSSPVVIWKENEN